MLWYKLTGKISFKGDLTFICKIDVKVKVVAEIRGSYLSRAEQKQMILASDFRILSLKPAVLNGRMKRRLQGELLYSTLVVLELELY